MIHFTYQSVSSVPVPPVTTITYNGLFTAVRLWTADSYDSLAPDLPNVSLLREADFSGTLSEWRCERAPLAPHSPPAPQPSLDLDRILAYAG